MSVSTVVQSEGTLHFITTLKYSVWRTGKEISVHFYRNDEGALSADISKVTRGLVYDGTTVGESKIFHTGWIRSDCVAKMTASDKETLINNLAKMKIWDVDADLDVYVCGYLW